MPRFTLLPTITSLILALMVTASTPPTAAAASSDPYGVSFGADELEPQTPRALGLASQANIDWVRMGLYWQDLEPSPGQFDFKGDDVATVVTRYKADVHYWEVWNEADLPEFWNGTAAQYAALLAVTSSTIKEIDPTATVVLGGQAFQELPGHPASAFQTQILGDLDHPAAPNFDLAAFHYYLPPEAAPQHFAEFKDTLSDSVLATGHLDNGSRFAELGHDC